MQTWTDADIRKAVAEGTLGVEPWMEADLTPNGLDLRIGSVLVPERMQEAATAGTVTIPPMTRFLIGTSTVVRMPTDAVGSLWLRSSFSRKGVIAAFGKVDAGFAGNLPVGCFNAGHEPLVIPIGERFCQIVFESLSGPSEKAYAQRSGNYQGQRGITLAKN